MMDQVVNEGSKREIPGARARTVGFGVRIPDIRVTHDRRFAPRRLGKMGNAAASKP